MGSYCKFFQPPEEGGLAGSVEKSQTRNETVESRLSHIIEIVYRVESRGIRVDNKSLGELMYIEKIAHERDQINWACSAQSKELLPESIRKPKPGTGRAAVQSVVAGLVSKGDY